LAAITKDGGIAVLDAELGTTCFHSPGSSRCIDAKLSLDGSLLAVGSAAAAGRLQVVDLDADRFLSPDDEPDTYTYRVALAGDRIAANSHGGMGVWDIETGKRIGTLAGRDWLSAHGDAFVTAGREGMSRYDARTCACLCRVSLPGGICSGGVDRAGLRFVATLITYVGLAYLLIPGVWLVDFSLGRASKLDLPEEDTQDERPEEDRMVAISPDGGCVAVCDPLALRLYDVHDGWCLLSTFPGSTPSRLDFSPDGSRLTIEGKGEGRGAGARRRIELGVGGWAEREDADEDGGRVTEDARLAALAARMKNESARRWCVDGDRVAYARDDGRLYVDRIKVV
jgi:WD40 repeat protein